MLQKACNNNNNDKKKKLRTPQTGNQRIPAINARALNDDSISPLIPL